MPDAEVAALGSAHGSDPKHHAIRANAPICTAPPDAPCRTSPTCECENWCCDDPEDHDPGEHCCMSTVKPGQGCWLLPWIEGAGLDDSFDHQVQVSPADYDLVTGEHTFPDGAIACDWDDGVFWTYAEPVIPPGQQATP